MGVLLGRGAIGGGSMIYSAARALQDTERMQREDEAHQGDQAIRQQRLENETELQPLRRRALEVGVSEAERTAARRPKIEEVEDQIRELNLDTAKFTNKEKRDTWERLQDARGRQKKLAEGLRSFYQSSEPQHVVDAFESINDIPAERRGAKATRNEDGSITLEIPGAQPQVFKAQKDSSGTMRSADDYFGMFAVKMLDPVEHLKNELIQEHGLAKERAKTDRAIDVANVRASAARDVADTRAGAIEGRKSEAWSSRQHSQIKPVLDSMLKPESSPSGFAAAYQFDADKALRGVIEEQVEAQIESGVPVRRAAKAVIDDVRAAYDTLDKKAKQHAQSLAKVKIKPNDRSAVEKAAQDGNADARELLKTLTVAEKNMGPSVAKYLEGQLPTK